MDRLDALATRVFWAFPGTRELPRKGYCVCGEDAEGTCWTSTTLPWWTFNRVHATVCGCRASFLQARTDWDTCLRCAVQWRG